MQTTSGQHCNRLLKPAAIAQFERALIRERTAAGLIEACRRQAHGVSVATRYRHLGRRDAPERLAGAEPARA